MIILRAVCSEALFVTRRCMQALLTQIIIIIMIHVSE